MIFTHNTLLKLQSLPYLVNAPQLQKIFANSFLTAIDCAQNPSRVPRLLIRNYGLTPKKTATAFFIYVLLF